MCLLLSFFTILKQHFLEKRKIFDQYGEEGLKAGFGGGADAADGGGGRRFSSRDPNDIFKQFFQTCVLPPLHLLFH
jgi:DnaJ-class molecular chaperone